MPSVFPGAIDSFVDPLSTSPLSSPSHALQHQNINDAVEKVEQYMGLVKVVPTSATNGTVGATGTVTVGNAVSSVTVNGAFSSLYDNYRIAIVGITPTVSDSFRFMLGSGATTQHFGSMTYDSYNNTSNGILRANNVGSFYVSLNEGTVKNSFISLDVFSPNLVGNTGATGSSFGRIQTQTFSGNVFNNTQYTSFTVLVDGAGTMTGGTIRIYGYRN